MRKYYHLDGNFSLQDAEQN